MKTKLFTLLFAIVANVGTMLASVTIDGITYNLNETELTAVVVSGGSYSGSIIIPESVTYATKNYNVTSIGFSAFYNCTSLTSVEIPSSVTNIEPQAFYGCYSLTSVSFPNSVTSIGGWAFSGCSSLTSPIYNAHVYAYMPTTYTGAFTIPEGIESIAGAAFSDCSGLTSVEIPSSVTYIGPQAFYNCSSLTTVLINSNAVMNGNYRMQDIFGSEVPNYIIGDSVTSIGDNVFYNCSGLLSVTIGNNVTSIGDYAFYMCTSLTSINIPNSVVRIGKVDYYTFKECESLPVIDGIRYADTYLIEPIEHLSTYKIKEGTRWIGADAFKEEFNLTSIVIPNSVEYIESGAFCECDELKSVTIGSGVTRIGAFAFDWSEQLKSIICLPQVPPTTEVEVRSDGNYGAFDDDASILLYVPTESVEAYRRDECWGKYEIHPLEAESVEVTDIKVVSTDTSAEVVWPAASNAATYELVIKDKDGNVICSLVFNGNGQLVSITFGAPTREKSVEATQLSGFSFTVADLEEGSTYDLTITAKDENNNVLDVKSMSFVAGGGEQQDIEEINVVGVRSSKLLHDGQILILRGDKTYTLTGQEVK